MARVRGSDFGETVLAVRADDSELRATLAKDETFVRESSAKMQGSLNSLSVSTQTVAVSADAAGNSFITFLTGLSLVTAVLNLLPGKLGAAASKVSILSLALKGLGKFALPVAAVGAALSAIAALVFRQDISDFFFGLDEAEKKALELQALLDKKIEDNAAKLKAARAEQARLEAEAAKQLAERIKLLDQEIAVLQGKAKATDFIVDREERERTIRRDTLEIEKQIAEQRRAELRAQGPGTAVEALLDIQGALRLEEARQQGLELLDRLTKNLLRVGEITREQFDLLRDRFFLDPPKQAREQAQPPRVGGIPITQFTDIAAFGRSAVDPGAKRDEARNKKLDTIITLQRRGNVLVA